MTEIRKLFLLVSFLLLMVVSDTALGKRTGSSTMATTTTDKVKCDEGKFTCANGNCIHLVWRCDLHDDCGDGSDELNCETTKCKDAFACSNDDRCIPLTWICDGDIDCGDGSDERDCGKTNGSSIMANTTTDKVKCGEGMLTCDSGICIPLTWSCDGEADCRDGSDELNCGVSIPSIHVNRTSEDTKNNSTSPTINLTSPRTLAVTWIKTQRQGSSATEKWGPLVHKFAVALYLADPDFSYSSNPTRQEIAYELNIQLLSRLAQKNLKDLPSSDLASFINGLLVTCFDPRHFYGVNLIQELRARVDNSKYGSPYLLLTLCNAGDNITSLDKKKLTNSFRIHHREFWTETQAISVMAMACAWSQSGSAVDYEKLKKFTKVLKKRQYRNGTVENLQTTALVLQALNSAEPEGDPNDFNYAEAMQQILSHQQSDGSFGNFMKTYYVLPVLANKSLVNVSSRHCQTVPRDEDSAANVTKDSAGHLGGHKSSNHSVEDLVFDNLKNSSASKRRIQYSLWIGDQRDIERTLTLRVPDNTSFYGIMEIASTIDSRYEFEYTVKRQKPYINMMSGTMDDPESGKFWFPYLIQDGKPMPVKKSPADVIPKENDHIVMWYRKGSWMV